VLARPGSHPKAVGELIPSRARQTSLSDESIEAAVAQAQAHLADVLGARAAVPTTRPPLRGRAANGTLTWVCPAGEWQCALGDYEELTWPQLDVGSLAPILLRRLKRRGGFPAVRTIGVRKSDGKLVAEFGVTEINAPTARGLRPIFSPRGSRLARR
jgi:hypothetical protein